MTICVYARNSGVGAAAEIGGEAGCASGGVTPRFLIKGVAASRGGGAQAVAVDGVARAGGDVEAGGRTAERRVGGRGGFVAHPCGAPGFAQSCLALEDSAVGFNHVSRQAP